MRIFRRSFTVALAALALLVGATPFARAAQPQVDNPVDYLATARTYAEAMMKHGRDRYGAQSSPLFASQLDRRTLSLPDAPLPDLSGENIRTGDRATNGGNPQHDQQLYELLYALSVHTGDARYARAADNALAWFFRYTQNPTTNLFAWGEHLCWDFRRDQAVLHNPLSVNQIHELFEEWRLWDRTYNLRSAEARRFALGLWQHQIHDQQNGLFSRHAHYNRYFTEPGFEFPRHGGFYIHTWAQAYSRAEASDFRREMLRAIELLVNSYEQRRKPNGAIPLGSNVLRRIVNTQDTASTLTMAVELIRAASLLPTDLAAKLRKSVSLTDDVIVNKLVHDLSPGGQGYLRITFSDTLLPGDPRKDSNVHPYTPLWAEGYGTITTAELGSQMLERFRQGGSAQYRQLALDGANLYLTAQPNADVAFALQPAAFASAIDFMLGVWHETNDNRYLQRADYFGRIAANTFLDSSSPLPKATSRHDHYETITGGDNLMLSFFKLHSALAARP